jgi:hypothetical protein
VDAFRFQNPLPFERDGRQHPVPDLLSYRVVEHLDIIEPVLAGFLAGSMSSAPDGFALEREGFELRRQVALVP